MQTDSLWTLKPGVNDRTMPASKNSCTDIDNVTTDSDSLFELEHGRSKCSKSDLDDMARLGRSQLLRRNFRVLSTFSFAIVLQASWEFLLVSCLIAYVAGNTGGITWSLAWTIIGFTPVVLSLAELSAMAPTAGGQYTWISEFAPPRCQKLLSYIVGWQSTLAWQAGAAAGSFLVGNIVQELVLLDHPSFNKPWQGTLLVFAAVLLLLCINVFMSGALPLLQNVLLVLHIFLFVAVLVCLWTLAPHRSVADTFTRFDHSGGWQNTPVSVLVGQVYALFGCMGTDAAAHMSEEVKDASVAVPRAIVWSYVINSVLAMVMMISFCFALTDQPYDTDPLSPFIFVKVFQAILPRAGLHCLVVGLLCVLMASNVGYNASTARQTWAFARDGGLIFNEWLSAVDPKRQIPTNSIIASCMITCLLALINIGSTVAFNAIISLNTVSLLLTYATSIGCVLHRRITAPDSLPTSRWSLGRWAIPINSIALLYSIFALFWTCWPSHPMPSLATFDWSSVIFVAVLLASVVAYACCGRHSYTPPLLLINPQAAHDGSQGLKVCRSSIPLGSVSSEAPTMSLRNMRVSSD